MCPNEVPGSHDLEDSEKEEENVWDKGEDNFSMCSDWDADVKEQDRKIQETKTKKDNEGKTLQNKPKSLSATALTLHPPESSIEQPTKMSNNTPTEEENKHETLKMIIGGTGVL